MSNNTERPAFPERVLITAGMPYGSKELHFGHIGGVFVHADVYARFMRDRIGADNVIFVSGTDCYGSPIVEKFRELKEANQVSGTVRDFVAHNHELQKKTLDDYQIGLNYFGSSALGECGKTHDEFSARFFNRLLKSGDLIPMSTAQFYDETVGAFLNGRQVIGKCPIAGCKSERGYADECSLGHQYFPEDLIDPVSTLSGNKPVLKDVRNWYLDMNKYLDYLTALNLKWSESDEIRSFTTVICDEFLKKPAIYLKADDAEAAADALSGFSFETEINEKQKNCKITFADLSLREAACKKLANAGIRFRTGKTLVPFRLSGNIEWGVKVPDTDGMNDLTFWVWPESLWAPISFTQAYLKEKGIPTESWRDWWCDDGSEVVQFIGEDNIYFYCLAEMAMFKAAGTDDEGRSLTVPTIISNKHILFFDKKASSSGDIKPPMAKELLQYYSAEQLRSHFLGLGLHKASVPFRPKPYGPDKDSKEGDPVYKEYSMFTNLLNRAARTTFYTFQLYNNGDSRLPSGSVSDGIAEICRDTLLKYERLMSRLEFSSVMPLLEDFFRFYNKELSKNTKQLQTAFDENLYKQTMTDAFHMLKTSAVLSHPIAPESTVNIENYLNADGSLYDWKHVFETLTDIYGEGHAVKVLEPKTDFFTRPQWQFA